MGPEVLIILVLILANGAFAMSEIAIVSARKARLQQWAKEGNGRAQTALDLANDPNRFLSTIQVGITLVQTLGNIYAGATVTERLAARLEGVPWISEYRNGIALALVVVAMTYLQVMIGELVPKALALHRAERIATWMARPMKFIYTVTAPLVNFLSASTQLVLRLLGSRPSEDPPVTGEEINVMVAQGTEAGVFEESQQDMVESVFELNERRVNSLMTPRIDIVWLDIEDSADQIKAKIVNSAYSRFPVCQGSLDQVLGVVHTNDILGDCLEGKALDLRAHVKQVLSVPETIPALKGLHSLRETGAHMALVIDEYGGVQGLVTLNDILETIVGEIAPQEAEEEPEAVRREDGSWLVDGKQGIEDFKELVGVDRLPDDEGDKYQTLGGLVMTHMGRIPKAGEHFTWENLYFEVMDMDGNRVDKVLVRLEAPARAEEAAEGAEGK